MVEKEEELKCEMSARPAGVVCGSADDVKHVVINQMGEIVEKLACRDCRDKMLTNFVSWG